MCNGLTLIDATVVLLVINILILIWHAHLTVRESQTEPAFVEAPVFSPA
jgi:competence protein ComGC